MEAVLKLAIKGIIFFYSYFYKATLIKDFTINIVMYLSFQKRGFRGKRGDVGYPLRHLSSIVFAVMIIIILFLIGSKYGEFSGYEKTYFAKDIAYSIDAIYAANGNIIMNYTNGLDRYA